MACCWRRRLGDPTEDGIAMEFLKLILNKFLTIF